MALSPQERSRRMRLNMLMAMSYALARGSSAGLFGSTSTAGILLGAETSGLAIDFTAPENRLLIRTTDGKANYLGNAFANDGGPVSFSRASLGTVVDSDGKIKWAPHNLLLASEQFDNSNWAKSSTTVTANTVAAPNGTTTAETVAASGANGTLLQSYSASAVAYTFGVWLKRKTGTGTIQIAADSGTWNTVTITADWALYTITQTPTAGSKTAGLRIVTSGDEVYVWGAHLYRSDLGGMVLNPARGDAYYPTTPRNLLGFTEDFSNAAWIKSGLAATPVLTNVLNGPNGLPTADKMVENSSASTHILFATVTVADGPKTFSVYAKAAERSWVFLRAGANIGAYFNLSAGSVGTADAGVTASIVSAGDGWYRCAITLNIAAGLTYPTIFISTGNGTNSYTGDGTSGIYLWGAQLSDSASLDAYSPVYGAAVTSAAYYAPRLDYDPVTLAANGLLVEEQRTNIVTYSQQFDQWTKEFSGSASVPTVTANVDTSPDGTASADKIDFSVTGSTSSDQSRIASNYGTVTNGTLYAYSIWLKAASAGDVGKRLSLAVGGFSSGSQVVTLTDSWQRVTGTGTAGSTVGRIDLQARGDLDKTVSALAWGGQIEVGVSLASTSFATSYIPTGAAQATRTADVASVSTQAFPYSATEGTIVASGTFVSPAQSGVSTLVSISNGNSGESINIYRQNSVIQLNVYDNGGSAQAAWSVSPAPSNLTKAALAYRANDFGAAVNGTSQTSVMSGTLPTVDRMEIGRLWSGAFGANGWIRQITYIPRRLTNAELQQRTS